MARPLALVTGASAGIGLSFAERLAREGHDLIIVARRRERLEALARRLSAEHGANVNVLPADLGTSAGIEAVAGLAVEAPLDLVINNAGFGAYRRFVELDPAVADELLSVHVRAVMQVTRAALPGMLDVHEQGLEIRRRGDAGDFATLRSHQEATQVVSGRRRAHARVDR